MRRGYVGAHSGIQPGLRTCNKAAAWALLSRLYLNAETYVGQNKYTECITYAKKVIETGYQLEPVYVDMFKADNHLSSEMIFPYAMRATRR